MSTATPGSVKPLLVLGLGNLLLRDDGFGPQLASRLQASLPEDPLVDIVDGGTIGLGLLSLLSERRAVIFLDAFHSGLPPGSLSICRDFQAEDAGSSQGRTSHDGNAATLLAVAALSGDLPPMLALVGVEPLEIETGIGLSAPVHASLPQAEAQTQRLIQFICQNLAGDLQRCV